MREFTRIDEFIYKDLKLKPTEQIIYATIYGFSQNGSQGFTGTIEFLQTKTNESRQAVTAALGRLLSKGLIVKEKMPRTRTCRYKAIVPRKTREEPEEVISDDEIKQEVESLYQCQESLHSQDEGDSNKQADHCQETCQPNDKKLDNGPQETWHRKDNEKKEIKDNENKKETPKKKVSNNPYVQTLYNLDYLDDNDVIPCQSLFSDYMGSPIERFDRAFWEFVKAYKAGETQYGVPYLSKFMKERLNNEKDHDKHTR